MEEKQMKSFMKYSYASYFIQLASGEYVTASRADCLRFDKDNPDKHQRWLWDEEERAYCIRLAPTAEGKQTGNDHGAAVKRGQRQQAEQYGCVHSEYCDSARDCIGCPNYQSRTVSLAAVYEAEDGETPIVRIEPQSTIGNPYEEAEKRAKVEALAAFLETLCEADRLLWDCWKDGMTENEIAAELGLKTRKGVYIRKKKLEEKIRSDANLNDFYGD
jgi:hypothetical protein